MVASTGTASSFEVGQEAIPEVRKLPLNPEDGDQILDSFGNVFEYTAEKNCWIFLGLLQDPGIVTEESDGLVSTEAFELICQIQNLTDAGVSFDRHKLFTGDPTIAPYFFLFYSSDRLVKFTPELTTDLRKRLRIEVDRAAIIARSLSIVCNGPKGAEGLKGDAGTDGTPAANEVFRDPDSITSDTIEISATVSTPIDTDISLRIFQDRVEVIEALLPLSGTGGTAQDVTFFTAVGFAVDESASEIFYDPSSEELTATIVLSNGEFDGLSVFEFKARQVGPGGRDGEDGTDFLEIVDDFFPDDTVKFSEAILSLRKSSLNDNLFFTTTRLFEEICVGRIRSVAGSLPIGTLEESRLASVELTTNSCKNIGSFQFVEEDFAPELDLPQWIPTKQCNDRRRFELANFDWFDQTSPAIPFTFVQDPEPPERCCQDKFFFCPNLGDACEIDGTIPAPSRGGDESTSTSSKSSSSSGDSSSSGGGSA